MDTAAWVVLAIAALCAVADWIAVARGNRPVEYVSKPATLAALIVVAALIDSPDDARQAWFLGALGFSLAGDVFLMLPRELFVAGLGAFLVAHVLYIAGFVAAGLVATDVAAGAVVPVLALAIVGPTIVGAVRRRSESLVAPVAAYMAAISVMVACAIGSRVWAAIAGAAVFFCSDALIAWNRFVKRLGWAPVAIMVTYHLGQAGLVVSLAQGR